jgi:histidyl-tRNA synthetase
MIAEAEVVAAVAEVFITLGFDDFRIDVNHRQLLRALIRSSGVPGADEVTALQAVDKFDKIGRDGVLAELDQRGIDAETARRLLDVLARPEGETARETLAALRGATDDESAMGALDELEEVFELLEHTPARGRHVFTPLLARGLGYYTGPIFEVRIPGYGFSFAGGGRYDELVGIFGKRQIPAVGFAIGLERILVVMEERGMYPDFQLGPDVMLCSMDVARGAILEVAHSLRGQGLRVEVFPDRAKLGKQLQYADSQGARYAAILGASEHAEGAVTLKELASGEQARVAVGEVGARVGTDASG